MTPNPRLSILPVWLWQVLGLVAIGLFFAAVGLCFVCIRNRRWKAFALGLPMAVFYFLLTQGCLLLELGESNAPRGPLSYAVRDGLLSVPPWLLLPGMALLVLAAALLWRGVLRFERAHITPLSVKEAVDNLPTGICCHLPGGRIILINRAMEALARTAAGRSENNGETLRDLLTRGELAPACRRVDTGEGPILLLPDGSARAISLQQLPWEGGELTAMLAADVTEAYRKTQDLEKQKERLFAINRRLAGYNREIVDLTIETEILAARTRLHDEIGADLLLMKKQLRRGVNDAELEELRRRLRRNISCLREDPETQTADELTVLLETAKRLGVKIGIEGEIPREAALSRVIITGLHECLTNLLRHAHGNALKLRLFRDSGRIRAEYSGNGDPPAGEICETGGLRILRACAGGIGGTMRVETAPDFRVILDLPEEVPHAV